MDSELLPLGLAVKLVAALALCFGALVGAAWFLRRRWPGLARLGVAETKRGGLTVIETHGLAPGTALHLLEVEGTRMLLLVTKERGEVLWTRDTTEGSFEEFAEEDPESYSPQRMRRPDAGTIPPEAWVGAGTAPLADRNRDLELHRERQRRYRERRRSGGRFQDAAQAPPMAESRP
jgi:flagellar biogenesis protein FliO